MESHQERKTACAVKSLVGAEDDFVFGPGLKGGFVQYPGTEGLGPEEQGAVKCTQYCMCLCCSPICIPLSIPQTLLGWIFFPVSTFLKDEENPTSCRSVVAEYCCCYSGRWALCINCYACCPINITATDLVQKFGNTQILQMMSANQGVGGP
mmetsp:Transcript_23815/g.33324  ORF Transcript_23815/g.33324 Transcript_23815/m.33324 type:complete len:152 (-) Transcript_23815:121-576(-)